MNSNEFLLDTDILFDHLYFKGSGLSFLELLMTKGLVFTTVINAAELIFNVPEKTSAIDVLNAVKVLGIHPKYSLNVEKFKPYVTTLNEAIFCSTAEINKLSIACIDSKKYLSTGLRVINQKDLK